MENIVAEAIVSISLARGPLTGVHYCGGDCCKLRFLLVNCCGFQCFGVHCWGVRCAVSMVAVSIVPRSNVAGTTLAVPIVFGVFFCDVYCWGVLCCGSTVAGPLLPSPFCEVHCLVSIVAESIVARSIFI